MAAAVDQSIEREYNELTDRQRLRAAVHYTTMKICEEAEEEYGLPISQQVVATITETVWKQMESFAIDLEHFAKHARRLVISPDDVKLLVRRNTCLLRHIEDLHQEQVSGREEPKKRGKKGKGAAPTEVRTSVTLKKALQGGKEPLASTSAASAVERDDVDVDMEEEDED